MHVKPGRAVAAVRNKLLAAFYARPVDWKQAGISVAIVAALLSVAVMIAHHEGDQSPMVSLNDYAGAILLALTIWFLVCGQVIETDRIVPATIGFFSFFFCFAMLYSRLSLGYAGRDFLQSDATLWSCRVSGEFGAATLLGVQVYRIRTKKISLRRTLKRFGVLFLSLVAFVALLWVLNGGKKP